MPAAIRICTVPWYIEKVQYLQNLGWTQKAIAKHLRISSTSVSRVIKTLKQES